MNAPIFFSGIILATFAASGVFFLKFYRNSRERFFLFFALACFLFALERIALFFVDMPFHSVRSPVSEANSWIYLIRLAGFTMIIWAVVQKNRRSRQF